MQKVLVLYIVAIRITKESAMNFITSFDELCNYLKLEPSSVLSNDIELVNSNFPLQVTKDFLQRVKSSDHTDPLLRQILPIKEELLNALGFSKDPLAENSVNPVPGLLHRYFGRVLLLVTQNCAMHCRFCFRRHLPCLKKDLKDADFQRIFKYIADDKTITEVILSGGDPLMLPDERLQNIFQDLAKIDHLKRIRIHSRVPIALPSRVNTNLILALTCTRFSPVIVIHCNHANEIDTSVDAAVQIFRAAKINVFNQSVLLKGVNDSVLALVELNEALGAIGVIPYYLHLLDKVAGAAHFAVSLEDAKILYREMQQQLPGYLVPRLVYESVGAKAKITPFN